MLQRNQSFGKRRGPHERPQPPTDQYSADGTPTHIAADGTPRKSRYGSGRQPWDDIKDQGWAPFFAASNVLKYLRRTKDREHSIESARLYYQRLCEYVNQAVEGSKHRDWTDACSAFTGLQVLLTEEEKKLLLPSTETPPTVKAPKNEDEAAMMCLLGAKWLEDNAPHRLRETYKQEHARTWNEAIDAAAKIANARFLVDPLTSPSIHIEGLKR